MADPVQIWVRSLAHGCRVSVDHFTDLATILDRLGESGALEGLGSLTVNIELAGDAAPSGSRCTFEVAGSPDRTLASLEDALRDAADVVLMLEPGR